jgi:ankyrin repeat protein
MTPTEKKFLEFAAMGRDKDLLGLISGGVDVNVKDAKSGRTALHKSCKEGWPVCVDILLRATPHYLNAKDFDGNTPMYLACQNGNDSIIKQLLDAGADPNIKNNTWNVPLSHPCYLGVSSTIKLLLAAGANPNIHNQDAQTPLHLTMIGRPRTEDIDWLLAFGADPNHADSYGDTPLHRAAGFYGDASSVSSLLAGGGDPNIRNSAEWTPFNRICFISCLRSMCLACMLCAGADRTLIPSGQLPKSTEEDASLIPAAKQLIADAKQRIAKIKSGALNLKSIALALLSSSYTEKGFASPLFPLHMQYLAREIGELILSSSF